MMNKAINRTDDKEAVILTEFITRVVSLVTGQMDALKVYKTHFSIVGIEFW